MLFSFYSRRLKDVGLNRGCEDPLEKETALHFSILVWKIPWAEEPGGLQPMESQKVRHNWAPENIKYSCNKIPSM